MTTATTPAKYLVEDALELIDRLEKHHAARRPVVPPQSLGWIYDRDRWLSDEAERGADLFVRLRGLVEDLGRVAG